MARGRCIATTSATPGRARTWARCSRGSAGDSASRSTSRSGTASTSSGHRHRSAPTARPSTSAWASTSVPSTPQTMSDERLPPPPRRCLRLLAGSRRERHDLHGRPRQLAERIHQQPDHQEAHAQVAVQPRARGGHLATSAHRPSERCRRRAPSTSPTTSPPTGRASSPPSLDGGSSRRR